MHIKHFGASIVVAMAISTAGCSSHMYADQAIVYAEAINHELVVLGVCADSEACAKRQMVFWEGGGWKVGPFQGGGASITVYGVADTVIADALIKRCGQIHALDPGVPMSIEIQSNAHIDNLHPGTVSVVKKAHFSASQGAGK